MGEIALAIWYLSLKMLSTAVLYWDAGNFCQKKLLKSYKKQPCISGKSHWKVYFSKSSGIFRQNPSKAPVKNAKL